MLTGDVHANWASDIKADFSDPSSPTVGSELVGTSITSGSDGSDTPSAQTRTALAENPHIKYYLNRRGYVRTRWTAEQAVAHYRAIPFVSEKDAPVHTAKTFVIEDGNPGLQPA